MVLERRRHPRADVNRPVIIRHMGRLIPGVMCNLSASGMRVMSEYQSFLHTAPVEIIFDLSPDEIDISLRGNIVRLEDGTPRGLGIQFTAPASFNNIALMQFLQTHTS